MTTENIVEIKDLRFAYGANEVLKQVSLTIPRGKVVGIMGASGTGKTTLMRLIGGQLRPAHGYVKAMGQVVHELNRQDLFQLRRKMGMQFQQGGMLMLYDEPFAGLDPISCNVIGNLIRRLNDALGVTSIVVSYDAQEALRVVDYVYFLADGEVAAEGTAEDVKSSQDPFVDQFIGGKPDGPVPFHYPAEPYGADLEMLSSPQ